MSASNAALTQKVRQFFQDLGARNLEVIGLNDAVVLELSDRPGTAWTVDFRDMRKGQVSEGADPNAAVTIKLPEAVLQAVGDDPEGARAFLRRSWEEIEVQGDLALANRLRVMFSSKAH